MNRLINLPVALLNTEVYRGRVNTLSLIRATWSINSPLTLIGE